MAGGTYDRDSLRLTRLVSSDLEDETMTGRKKFATMHVTMRVPPSVDEPSLRTYLEGIGDDVAAFSGFASRRLVELPMDPNGTRKIISLLKFEGSSAAEAYAGMREWADSSEKASWTARAAALGIESQGQLQKTAVGLARVGVAPRQRRAAEDGGGAPPKWKIAVLVELWLYPIIVLHGLAGTNSAVARIGHTPVQLLVSLSIVVPVLTYLGLPLSLSLSRVSAWVNRRAKRPVGPLTSVLEDGFELLRPVDPGWLTAKEAAKRFAALDRRISRLAARVDDDRNKKTRRTKMTPPPPVIFPLKLDDDTAPKKAATVGASLFKSTSHRAKVTVVGGGDAHPPGDVEAGGLLPCEDEDDALAMRVEEAGRKEDSKYTDPANRNNNAVMTLIVKHCVRWGMAEEFAAFAQRIDRAMRGFDGFLGLDVIKLDEGGDADFSDPDTFFFESVPHIMLFRFANLEGAREWLASDERRQQLAGLDAIVETDQSEFDTLTDFFKSERMNTACDMTATKSDRSNDRCDRNILGELLFHESGTANPRPALYKVAVLTVIGLFLVMWPITANLGPIVGAAVPPPVATLILTCLNVAANTYFGAPLMHFFFSPWLKRPPPDPSQMTYPACLAPVAKLAVSGFQHDTSKIIALLAYLAILILAVFIPVA